MLVVVPIQRYTILLKFSSFSYRLDLLLSSIGDSDKG